LIDCRHAHLVISVPVIFNF